MSEGISNFQIEQALKNIDDPDVNDNFVGAFPANHMNKFIDFKLMISEKREICLLDSKYSDSSDKKDMHWWSILDIEPKTDIFFLMRLVVTD